MKLLIVGSRSFNNYEQMKREVYSQYSIDEISQIISGGAAGADTLARSLAHDHSIPFVEFPANWGAHGKRAGILRNMTMVDEADEVFAFWDGESRGTEFTIQYTKEKQKPLHVVQY